MKWFGLALTFTVCLGPAVEAAEVQYAFLSREIPVGLPQEAAVFSWLTSREANTLLAPTEPQFGLHLSHPRPSITHRGLGPLHSPLAKRFGASRRERLFFEELRLDWAPEGMAAGPILFGGMFTPRFGRAWEYAPDIFGIDFAGDFELSERLGFGGGYVWKNGSLGPVSLRFSAHFRGTEFDETASTDLRRDHGRADITGSPQSFTVSAEGSFKVAGTLKARDVIGWQLAIVTQANELGGTARENGVAVSVSRTTALANGARLTGLIEYAGFDNVDNEPGLTRHYLTGALAVERGKWRLSGTASWRREREPGTDTRPFDDLLATVSLGYRPRRHLEVSLGYRYTQVGGLPAHTIGVFAVHEF